MESTELDKIIELLGTVSGDVSDVALIYVLFMYLTPLLKSVVVAGAWLYALKLVLTNVKINIFRPGNKNHDSNKR